MRLPKNEFTSPNDLAKVVSVVSKELFVEPADRNPRRDLPASVRKEINSFAETGPGTFISA
jgi:hypothetical protein